MTITNTNRFKFTKTKLAEVAAPTKTTCYFDTEIKQLFIRVSPTGRKSFGVSKRVNGQPDKIMLGTFPILSVENARKIAAEKLYVIEQGGNPREEKRKKLSELTLDQYFQQYCKNATKKTIGDDKGYYRRYIEKRWSTRRLSEIRTIEIREMHNELGVELGMKCAANHALVMLRTLYNTAMVDEVFSGLNPTAGIKLFKIQSRERFLSKQEMPYFLDALQMEHSRQAAMFFLLLLFVGQRKTDTLAMRWEHIDFDEKTWFLPYTKNGKSHTAVLAKAAIAVLQAIQKYDSPWVFPSFEISGQHMGEPRKSWSRIKNRTEFLQLVDLLKISQKWTEHEVESLWHTEATQLSTALHNLHQIAKIAKIDTSCATKIRDFRIHDLRRTFGSNLVACGATLQMAGHALGHKSVTSTQIYTRFVQNAGSNFTELATQNMIAGRQMVYSEIEQNQPNF